MKVFNIETKCLDINLNAIEWKKVYAVASKWIVTRPIVLDTVESSVDFIV